MRHPLGLGRDPTQVFQGSSRFPSPSSCLHHKSLIYQKTGESSAFRMHFLLFSLQWKCHLSKASCYHAFPMPNTWPPRRGFYLYISSDLYFSFKELHALRHPKCSQHKEVRLHEMPPNRTKKKRGRETAPLPTAAAVPNNPRPFVDVTLMSSPVGPMCPEKQHRGWHGTARHGTAAPCLPSSQMLPRVGIWGLEKQPPSAFGGGSRPRRLKETKGGEWEGERGASPDSLAGDDVDKNLLFGGSPSQYVLGNGGCSKPACSQCCWSPGCKDKGLWMKRNREETRCLPFSALTSLVTPRGRRSTAYRRLLGLKAWGRRCPTPHLQHPTKHPPLLQGGQPVQAPTTTRGTTGAEGEELQSSAWPGAGAR